MERFDDELNEYLRRDDKESECQECGTPIQKEFGYCSWTCHSASMR